MRLEKVSSPLIEPLTPLLKEIARVVGIANASGIANSSIRVQPLMIGRRHDYFKNGVCFEVFNPHPMTAISSNCMREVEFGEIIFLLRICR